MIDPWQTTSDGMSSHMPGRKDSAYWRRSEARGPTEMSQGSHRLINSRDGDRSNTLGSDGTGSKNTGQWTMATA